MPKLLGAAPFPRRPSSFLRYGVLALVLVTIFCLFYRSSNDLVHVDSPLTRPAGEAQEITPHIDPTDKNEAADSKPVKPPPPPAVDSEKSDSSKKPTGGSSKPPPAKQDDSKRPAGDVPTTDSEGRHPIDKLVYNAQREFAAMSSGESKTVEEAAQAYRKRRGRHPPPHFDKWFEYARSHNALIVEGFFDQIYDDLEPFWGIDPAPMRREASQFEMTISVRNGVATTSSDWRWTRIWHNMTKTIEDLLPDMDIALNPMDEPRLVVPWEDINAYMKNASHTKNLPKAAKMVNQFRSWPKAKTGFLAGDIQEKKWESDTFYWKIARRGCPPDSLARTSELQSSFQDPPVINNKYAEPHLYKGYVSNYTKSVQICHQPDLQGLEGILIHPLSTKSTKIMFPMFGGSKLTVNNEILLPAPMYYSDEERFVGGDDHGIEWADKKNKAIWRGVATGGKNKAINWRGFQRHRFVAMNNGTKVGRVESGDDKEENFALPEKEYGVQAHTNKKMGPWIDEFADVAFIDLMCHTPDQGNKCNYTNFYYHPVEGIKLATQFNNKFLPDIDGNSFSGRYLGFLRSTSLPIKSTIFREWHDSRLVPWKHFVPMDNRFTDYYGIMEYFLGYQGHNAHDRTARKIALEGKEWADQVLRKEDMQIYMLRLLLEYARVMDDDREILGWVDDVIKNPSLEKSWSWWW